MTSSPGTQLGPYRLLSLLGTGGMGQVFLAQDARLDRKLALKLLSVEFTKDEDRVRRFQLEARAASALNHPNIITIYEIGQIEDAHFIATEFIDGRTLRQELTPSGMKLRQILEVTVQIASALQAAHAAGIIHRDIKPENIMLRPDGYVKVLDFGLAKLTEKFPEWRPAEMEAAPKALVNNTSPGVVLGTVSYMSPEQARGWQVDERTDIFSLGVVLYEMITGRPPFDGATVTDILALIIEREPLPLARYASGIPAELEWIVSKSLAKDRDERYQTVKDLLLDLRRLKQRLDFEAELERSGHSGSRNSGATVRSGSSRFSDTVADPATRTYEIWPPRRTSSAEYLLKEVKRRNRGALLTLVLFVMTLSAFLYFATGEKPIKSVAVLPFVNLNADANTEYLGDAITESIINSLSQLPNLAVLSRNAVLPYKGQDADLRVVGRNLGVQAVLTGRITQRGESLSISIALVDTRDNRHLWGEQYNRRFADLLLVQEEVAQDISDKLRLKLSGEEKKRLEAYQLYVKGRNAWNKRTADGLREGIRHFEQATRVDPNYAPAYAGLADCYNMLVVYSALAPQEAFPTAKEAAQKALEIDETLAEAHSSLAYTLFQWDWKWEEAEREFKRAIELKSGYGTAHQWYSNLLTAVGRFDEAIAEAKQAQEMAPLSLIANSHLGWVFYLARQYDQSIAQAQQTLKLDPNFFPVHRYLGLSYAQQGRYEEAIAAFEKAATLSRGSALQKAELGHTYAIAGKLSEARQTLTELREMSAQRHVSPLYIALLHAGLNEKDQAFAWLEKAYQERAERLVWLKVDPRFDNLRSDPRFADLLRRMDLAP